MKITSTATKPFEIVALDIVKPLPATHDNNRFTLTIQDNPTKYCAAIAIPNAEAHTVAEKFVSEIIGRRGIPTNILIVQGTNFLSTLFSNV